MRNVRVREREVYNNNGGESQERNKNVLEETLPDQEEDMCHGCHLIRAFHFWGVRKGDARDAPEPSVILKKRSGCRGEIQIKRSEGVIAELLDLLQKGRNNAWITGCKCGSG